MLHVCKYANTHGKSCCACATYKPEVAANQKKKLVPCNTGFGPANRVYSVCRR